MVNPENIALIEHVFRHEHGKIIALLVHKYGSVNIEKIEDAVQDALLKAMQIWPFKETPNKPTAWLLKVAKNSLLDSFKKENRTDLQESNELFEKSTRNFQIEIDDSIINDSQLKMIFACCNPKLSDDYQLILSLKLIGGFSNKELSNVLLKKEDSIAKAYTRAKKKFKEEIKTLDIPIEMTLATRIRNVLKVIYLIYTEGYRASTGSEILKKDLCYEAIRLALLILENKSSKNAEVHALIALMCFHTARFDARISKENELVDLEHQERNLYDKQLISLGVFHLEKSTVDNETASKYYYQALIAYYYTSAQDFDSINWREILNIYKIQLKHFYSPIIELNSLVPYYKIHGPEKGLERLNEFENRSNTKMSALYYSILGELNKQLGRKSMAKDALVNAIELTQNEMEKSYLVKKLYNI